MNPAAGASVEHLQQQLQLFAQDFQVLVSQERLRRREAEQALRELSGSYLTMVRTLATVTEIKDTYTRSHLDRCYQYAMRLTQRVAPELATDARFGYGFLLHDVGKVGVPDAILNKPGPLDEDEWKVMQTHPVVGVQLVEPIRILGDAIAIIKSHHERWDGGGYPEGLAGEDIHIGARIFSVIDTWDAMTTTRPYRKALPVHAALEEIDVHAGTQFDPEVATAFVDLCEELGIVDLGTEGLTIVR